MNYLQMSAADQGKVRREMFVQAVKMYRDAGMGRQMARMSARKMVREALEMETHGNPEDSNTQQLAD